MSNIPRYGTPDADSPEVTEAEFAKARWRRDGSLVDPVAYARQTLIEMQERLRGVPGRKIENTLRHVEAALKEMEA